MVEDTTAVTTVLAPDLDPATLVFSIAGGADAARFQVDALTGALSFITAPNFEIPTDVGLNNIYEVAVQATDGEVTEIQSFAVTVTDDAAAAPPGRTTVWVTADTEGFQLILRRPRLHPGADQDRRSATPPARA